MEQVTNCMNCGKEYDGTLCDLCTAQILYRLQEVEKKVSCKNSTNSDNLGQAFLNEIRAIIEDCSKLDSPARAARVTAFAICVMLDGSGEHLSEEQYRVITEDGKLVEFFHHDL